MAISFPFEFVDLGVPVPFVILPNPDFPGETKPLCILENQGVPPGPDTFITSPQGHSFSTLSRACERPARE